MKLETGRTILPRFEKKDLDDLNDYCSQDGVGEMAGWKHHILDYLFSSNIEYVYACCFQNNRPSKQLIEKCGFTFEQESSFYAESLDKSFKSFEYVYSKNYWQLQKKH